MNNSPVKLIALGSTYEDDTRNILEMYNTGYELWFEYEYSGNPVAVFRKPELKYNADKAKETAQLSETLQIRTAYRKAVQSLVGINLAINNWRSKDFDFSDVHMDDAVAIAKTKQRQTQAFLNEVHGMVIVAIENLDEE